MINLYKTRMQIEEGFRDIKNSRWGLLTARPDTVQKLINDMVLSKSD